MQAGPEPWRNGLLYSAPTVAYRHLAIDGPIGSGKTRLAERLAARLEGTAVLERADNPFLADFYTNRPGAALQAQLFFLLNRHRQLSSLRQADLFQQTTVVDYVFDKDKIFAFLNLDDNELFIYQRLFDLLARDITPPDLVVYLQAPVDVLMERIARRRIPMEQQIERGYLERLNQAYARFFHDFDEAPLLSVNAATIDPIGNPADFEELLAAIQRMKRGRLYYNPLRHKAL
jgi:deoxyadenosine/deoxycytidine kinase